MDEILKAHSKPQYSFIMLIKAGAKVDEGWDKYIKEIKKLHN